MLGEAVHTEDIDKATAVAVAEVPGFRRDHDGLDALDFKEFVGLCLDIVAPNINIVWGESKRLDETVADGVGVSGGVADEGGLPVGLDGACDGFDIGGRFGGGGTFGLRNGGCGDELFQQGLFERVGVADGLDEVSQEQVFLWCDA